MHGNDKYGRSLVWVRCRNFLPAQTTEEGCKRFMTYALDLCQVRMKKCADQFVFILDLEGLSYQNFDLQIIKSVAPIIQVRFQFNGKRYRQTMRTLWRAWFS